MFKLQSSRTEHQALAGEQAAFAMLLNSGGDDRLVIDPSTGRNKYGVPPSSADDEIWLSSSTASAISPRGFSAARQAYLNLVSATPGRRVAPDRWFDDLRARLVALVGCPGTEAILCASGTETEILALTLARTLMPRPLTNIVIAKQETGAGVMHAAAGTHFDQSTALQASVEKGTPLEGWQHGAIQTSKVDIRDAEGRLRSIEDVDCEISEVVATALRQDRDVQLHILDTSKAGQGGPSRIAAEKLFRQHDGRIVVVVDACQLRCSFETIRADLRAGFLVMITGSKFVGGPPFCGALLIPKSIVERLDNLEVPAGLAAYSAQHDWPKSMRSALVGGDFTLSNLGLGLRWEAALAEIEAYDAVSAEARRRVVDGFGDRVCELVAARPNLGFLDDAVRMRSDRTATLFPIVVGSGDPAHASKMHRSLREPVAGRFDRFEADVLARRCHVGQPVVIGDRAALRFCVSMPTIVSVAARLHRLSLRDALAPVFSDLEITFRKWDLLEQGTRS